MNEEFLKEKFSLALFSSHWHKISRIVCSLQRGGLWCLASAVIFLTLRLSSLSDLLHKWRWSPTASQLLFKYKCCSLSGAGGSKTSTLTCTIPHKRSAVPFIVFPFCKTMERCSCRFPITYIAEKAESKILLKYGKLRKSLIAEAITVWCVHSAWKKKRFSWVGYFSLFYILPFLIFNMLSNSWPSLSRSLSVMLLGTIFLVTNECPRYCYKDTHEVFFWS